MAESQGVECITCGGTDFYKESGYFYCNDCQTQSQEIREHAFQEEIAHVNVKSTRKIKQAEANKTDNKITSWECYNLVLCSLTEQLISLGADKNLKPVVKYLWISYLEKLEVFNIKYDDIPKLPLINRKKDASILYSQSSKKKKRKKSTSDESSATLDIVTLKRERSKKKRALAQAEYDEFSQKSTQDFSSTIHSETLTSLKSSSDKSASREQPIAFSRHSIRELRSKMSRRHYLRHKYDKEQTMECHKFTYASCSEDYSQLYYVSPIKLYCLLYLGLLINKDKIQLSDLFGFIKEGHLSFNKYKELLPPHYLTKMLNIQNNNKNRLFSNKLFRITSAKLAKLLNVIKYIQVVDIIELSQRFCKELNLPDEVFSVVENIISKTNPKLSFSKKDTIIPNYEGRAISIIIFALKLLFGLDGLTEFELSKYAQLVNSTEICTSKMFDVKKWLEYIGYRTVILTEYHFPTAYDVHSYNVNSDLFFQYATMKNVVPNENVKLTKEMTNYKQLLTNLQELERTTSDSAINFPPSLTPFSDYSKMQNYEHDKDRLLAETFHDCSIDFLLRPNKYLQLVGENIKTKHGGANDNWVIEKVKSVVTEKAITYKEQKLCPVQIVTIGAERHLNCVNERQPLSNSKRDPLYVQREYEKCRKDLFEQNEKYLSRISKRVLIKEFDLESLKRYNHHFNPYERYWLYVLKNVDLLGGKILDDFFTNHSSSFKTVFKECTRIIEQTVQELVYEFQFCELFLVYAATYKDKSDKPKPRELVDTNLQCYINHAETYW